MTRSATAILGSGVEINSSTSRRENSLSAREKQNSKKRGVNNEPAWRKERREES